MHFLHEDAIVEQIQQCFADRLVGANASRTYLTQALLPGVEDPGVKCKSMGLHIFFGIFFCAADLVMLSQHQQNLVGGLLVKAVLLDLKTKLMEKRAHHRNELPKSQERETLACKSPLRNSFNSTEHSLSLQL